MWYNAFALSSTLTLGKLEQKAGNENWVYCYDFETKQQFLLMESPDLFRYKESEAILVKNQECAGDYSLVVGALFIVNLFLQEKWLTSITTGKFCSI